MKIVLTSVAAVAAALIAAAPASAVVYTVQVTPNPVTATPTSGTLTPQTVTAASGSDQIYYQFGTTLATSLSATFQSVTPSFQFSPTIMLYTTTCSGAACTGGTAITPLDASSTPTGAGSTQVAFTRYFLPANANYTIMVSGTGTDGGSDVNALFRFSTAPEPASWGLMLIGFGAIGGALRTSRRKVVFA